jgi:hypothetical protein
VLLENHGMMRVFHKCGYHVESELIEGVYQLHIPFDRRTGRKRVRTAKEPRPPRSR